jgi:hypothetical protein
LGGLIPDEEDPILVVRKKYCDKAVETAGQIGYIEEILEYKSTATIVPNVIYQPYNVPPIGGRIYVHPTYDYKGGLLPLQLNPLPALPPHGSEDCFVLSYALNKSQPVETQCLPHKCGKVYKHSGAHACNKCLFLYEA